MMLLSLMLITLAEGSSPPYVTLNAELISNQTERVLMPGSAFTLRCHGNGSVEPLRWTTTAFRLRYRDDLNDTVWVLKAEARHTGTYSCGSSWLHIYVPDPAHVFVTPKMNPAMVEGQDFLFECLLTDPSATDLALRWAGNGRRGLPRGMNVALDPQRGALIRALSLAYKGRYVCSATRKGAELTSTQLYLFPVSSSLPMVSITKGEVLRLKGEELQITCLTTTQTYSYLITWTHSRLQLLNTTVNLHSHNSDGRLNISSTLVISAVQHHHHGTFICTVTNKAGVATATTTLTVLDVPYIRLYLLPLQNANVSTYRIETNGKMANISTYRREAIGNMANISTYRREANGKMANVSAYIMKANGKMANVSAYRREANKSRISGFSRVEVHAREKVKLSLLVEAYPPILHKKWTTPSDDILAQQGELYFTDNRCVSSLLLRSVRPEDEGSYSFHCSSRLLNASYSLELHIYRKPSTMITLENRTLTCTSWGYPLPTIHWYICPGVQDTCGGLSTYQVAPLSTACPEGESRQVLPSTTDDVTVECVASNHMGTSHHKYISYVPQVFWRRALVGASSAVAVLSIILLVVLYKYKQKPKYEIRWKIIDSYHGNSYSFIDPSQLPYDPAWEFPRDKLRLGRVLGCGAFGKVVEATAYDLTEQNSVMRVAVKMLKPSARSEEREALMSELKILSHLGYHDNIVNLLGACTHGGPMLVITEYCRHGDLLNFLRGRAQDFLEAVLRGSEVDYKNMAALRIRSDSGISCCSHYQEMPDACGCSHTCQGQQAVRQPEEQIDRLCLRDLMVISYQVAQGLGFLSARNCIHRDVAARNVLLTEGGVAKICDFGLARDITNDDNYVVKGNARLPVKWMSPESIFQCVYTVHSDVWSYGVLLWEIFSLGKSPYPNIAVDTKFYKMIKDGCHMAQPEFAPPEMYQLMVSCWDLEPTDRPPFTAIGQIIKTLFPTANDTVPHHDEQASECKTSSL